MEYTKAIQLKNEDMSGHYLFILEKVSFDAQLFEKELLKSLTIINKEELKKFKKWCFIKFGRMYKKLLQKSFRMERKSGKLMKSKLNRQVNDTLNIHK